MEWAFVAALGVNAGLLAYIIVLVTDVVYELRRANDEKYLDHSK